MALPNRYDENGNEYQYVNPSGGYSLIIVAFLIILAVLALPIVIFWKILFRGFFKPKNQKYNRIKNSLSKFKRVVLMIWVIYGYLSLFLAMTYSGTYFSTANQYLTSTKYEPFFASLGAIILITLNALVLKNKGLNIWSGVQNVKYKSITRAIGLSEFILLGVFAFLSIFTSLITAAWIAVVATIVAYFVIENFL